MLRYMLDTNICIYVIKNRPTELREKFNRFADELCISAVTLAELVYGAEKSAKVNENLAAVEKFSKRLEVRAFAEHAAQHFGQVRAELERSGGPIGPYDLMIAGHARSEALTLVTDNEREFQRVQGLRVENWT